MRWLPVPGYPGYEVSEMGTVRTYLPLNGRGGLKASPRPVRQDKAKGKTYWRVNLLRDGKAEQRSVHQLVAEAFHGPRPKGMQVRHLNGNSQDNRECNVKWGTSLENAQDRVDHGTQVTGEAVAHSVLTQTQVDAIRAHLPNWVRGDGRKFAIRFGVGDSAISAIKRGLTWQS